MMNIAETVIREALENPALFRRRARLRAADGAEAIAAIHCWVRGRGPGGKGHMGGSIDGVPPGRKPLHIRKKLWDLRNGLSILLSLASEQYMHFEWSNWALFARNLFNLGHGVKQTAHGSHLCTLVRLLG